MNSHETHGGKQPESQLEGTALLNHLLDKIDECEKKLQARRGQWDNLKNTQDLIKEGGACYDIQKELGNYIENYLDKIYVLSPQKLFEKEVFQRQLRLAAAGPDLEKLKKIFVDLKEKIQE